jgi:single-stranded DNA-binding protein
MSDTNFISGIVKILEIPKQKIIKNNTLTSRFRAQFPQVRKNCIVHLKFWGNLAKDVSLYYKVNDYILIEGYVALQSNSNNTSKLQRSKKIEITVLKIYPFILR